MARGCGSGVIVNVGTFKGGSAIVIAEANPSVSVLAIDTFVGAEGFGGAELEAECLANLRSHPRVCCLRCDSVDAAEMVRTEVAAVFVDGDHTYEGCLRDLEAWWPKLRRGGIMCGHDCVEGTGVPRALLEFCMSKGLPADVLTGACHGFFIVRKP